MIIICEPQCIGFEHSPFNAALVTLVKYTFPDEKIIFLAETEHIQFVKDVIPSNLENIEFKTIKVPPRHLFDQIRFPLEFRLFKKVFDFAKEKKSEKIIFSSIRRPGIVLVKLFIRKYRNTDCIIVLHSIIEYINNAPYKLIEIPFWLRFCLSFANIIRLKYLILGPTIEKEFLKKLPALKKYTITIDHPYFFKPEQKIEPNTKMIRFGFFGVGSHRKGIDLFFQLADEIKARQTTYKAEFIMIGPLVDKQIYKSDSVLIPSPKNPLTSEDFESYAKKLIMP
ncbi:hypothetical protein [Methanobacterium ferruginis]|uniref:hypothetical protein n=1 Tax=Methanobacterium ferruginis TaxID=710191 RepID=UPI0025742F62|nr:hypothetical protein [Methanobacterium ferruginis]BDZ69002.1 hypothetical protein GCM10025860_24500 [Methanobacterium ferruginis]